MGEGRSLPWSIASQPPPWEGSASPGPPVPLPQDGCGRRLGSVVPWRGMGPRRCPRRPRFCCRVVDLLLKAIMRTMWLAGGFHHVVVKGRQAPPTEAAILTLAPHSSYFDAIPVTMTMSSVVMKAESRDIPIWGSE